MGAHFTAFALALAGAAAIAGCAQVPVQSKPEAATRQPLARLQLPTDSPAGHAAALLIAAGFALQHDATEKAAHDYAQAAQLSNDPEIAQHALQLAFATRAGTSAAKLIKRWRALGAGPRELAGARARLAMLQGDRSGAERQFKVVLAPGDVKAWKAFAKDLLGARDSALAGVVLQDLAKPARLPANAGVWVAMSRLGEHLGRHAFARRLADAAVRRFGGPDTVRWAASLHLAAGDRSGALALYAKGIGEHPHDVGLRLGYAALLGKQHKYDKALDVLQHGPQTAATWSAQVAFAARAKNKTALRRIYTRMQRAPDAQRGANAFLLGQLAELLKHDRQALHWYKQVASDTRHAFEARVRSAVLLDKQGQSAAAHTLAHQLEHDYVPDRDRLRTAYELDAQLYARNDEHAKAIAAYDRGLAALPNDPTLVYDRGIVEATVGNTDAALKDFRHVLKLQPGDVEAMNALGFTLADANRNLREATKLLKRALAAKPKEAAIMDSWGWLQFRLGNFTQAETWLRRAWDKGTNPDVGVHLGEVLWKLGQHQHAREVFAKVRKLDPHNAALQRAEGELRP